MKVGDWVIYKDEFKKVLSCEGNGVVFDDTKKSYAHINSVKLWKPKEGEWCWYKHHLVRIDEINEYGYVRAMSASFYEQFDFYEFLECGPFIGQLPSFIKDKQ